MVLRSEQELQGLQNRFDEGVGAPMRSVRSALLHKTILLCAAIAAQLLGAAADGMQTAPSEILLDGADAKGRVIVQTDGKVVMEGVSLASFVTLKWQRSLSRRAKVLGGMWERTYGDGGWRGAYDEKAPREGSMPWYFLANDGVRTDGWGVQVQPNAFASWKITPQGVELLIDVRAGSSPVELGGRRLELCTLVFRRGKDGESPFEAGRAFCRMMCPKPRLPKERVWGYNDWYCAYGNNTATNFLADAMCIIRLADRGGKVANRPFAVVDHGWELNESRGDNVGADGLWVESNSRWNMPMGEFCRRVRALDARPGLWYRPTMPWKAMPEAMRLNGFSGNVWKGGFLVDPTAPELHAFIKRDIARFRFWGIKLIKIDFITYDLNNTWGFAIGERVIPHAKAVWRDKTRTSAEVIKGIYATMREAAGDDIYIVGCNAIDHFVAGLFELQRIGDDTSGKEWARTRKMGPNALAMRSIHNGTFYLNDGDCVGLASAGDVPWEKNRQWLDLVSRSGTVLFVSWKRSLLTDHDVVDFFSRALKVAATEMPTGEPLDWMETLRPLKWRFGGGETATYDW